VSNFGKIPERRIALRARLLAFASCVAGVCVLGSVLLAKAQTEPPAKPQAASTPIATSATAPAAGTVPANDFAPTSEVFAKVKTAEGRRAFVQNFCTSCHSARAQAGNLVLEGVTTDNLPQNSTIWENVVRRVGAGEMPPRWTNKRPDPKVAHELVAGLVRELDDAARKQPYAGRTVIRRLNRTEYGNAVRDLLQIDFPYGAELPKDAMASGFDNIGDALSMSPLLLESYLRVARRVADLALGEGDATVVTDRFPAVKSQAVWQGEGMPFETRGGVRIKKFFPRDGEYDLRAFLNEVDLTPTEGVRFFHTRVPVKAGEHVLILTFPERYGAQEGPVPNLDGAGGAALGGPVDARGSAVRPTIMFMLDGKTIKEFEIAGPNPGEAVSIEAGPPTLARAEITGPYNAGPAADTVSRKHILICQPQTAAEEKPCAERIVGNLLHRAWRRDVTPEEVAPFVGTFEKTRATRSFTGAVSLALRDILVSPDFLFRLEIDPAAVKPGQAYRVNDFDLASRLSFFLWSSIPDDRLLGLAAKGQLRRPGILDAETRRMLADERANSLIDNFAIQWLELQEIDGALPDPRAYPEFDSALREAFLTETKLFLRSIMRENRSVMDVVNANYTFLNERLAKVYGVPDVVGPGFRRVQLADNSPRGGVTGMGSILMVTSHTNKTSPVLRGKWVLANLLDSPPNPPPAGVPPLNVAPGANGKVLTTREQVERHRANPVCNTCHSRMDPYGFSLENFDVIGRWRDKDEGGAIDASVVSSGGQAFVGPTGLKKALAANPGMFVTATTSRLMTYALGRPVAANDMPMVRQIVAKSAPTYKFEDIVLGIVRSTPFQMKEAAKP
jgi:mono/diheme cytochrome c family protein